ncbi:MAG: hypothetical protein LR015_05925 [Verrucomicrobia bacterium]|nr:hypothetical protein [Verrucomicrobiota bacterium]
MKLPVFKVALAVLINGSFFQHNVVARSFELMTADVIEIQDAMNEGILTSESLVEMFLRRIDAYNSAGPEIQAIISLNSRALETARALDVERAISGPRSCCTVFLLLLRI